MPDGEHSAHIARHLQTLQQAGQPQARIDELLRRAGLVLVGDAVANRDGSPLDGRTCARYLTALGQVMGESIMRFTRASFALAGCKLDAT